MGHLPPNTPHPAPNTRPHQLSTELQAQEDWVVATQLHPLNMELLALVDSAVSIRHHPASMELLRANMEHLVDTAEGLEDTTTRLWVFLRISARSQVFLWKMDEKLHSCFTSKIALLEKELGKIRPSSRVKKWRRLKLDKILLNEHFGANHN